MLENGMNDWNSLPIYLFLSLAVFLALPCKQTYYYLFLLSRAVNNDVHYCLQYEVNAVEKHFISVSTFVSIRIPFPQGASYFLLFFFCSPPNEVTCHMKVIWKKCDHLVSKERYHKQVRKTQLIYVKTIRKIMHYLYK